MTAPRSATAVGAAIVLYTLLRVAGIPQQPELTLGFEHDGAYFSIVAKNLMAGRGYVNDAHWLVFLNPDSLPIPYHNGKPFYPTLMAAIAAMSGMAVEYTGFMVAALASGLLVGAVTLIARFYVGHLGTSLALGLVAALFPPVFEESLWLEADALYAALFCAFIAALLRAATRGGRGAAGVLLGLAWLTRGQIILAVPAILLYTTLRWGGRRGVGYFLQIGVIAVLVASPWLVHMQRIWGNPLRSDDYYYLVQNLEAQRRHRGSLERYWHSPTAPPGLAMIVAENPRRFVIDYARGGWEIFQKLAQRHWSLESRVVGVLLAAGIVLTCIRHGRSWSPEALALVLYGVTLVAVFAIRGKSFQVRYFDTLSVFFALLSAAGYFGAWETLRRHHWPVAARLGVAAAGVILWLALVPAQAFTVYQEVNRPNDRFVEYRSLALEVHRRFARGQPIVVGTKPYYYTLTTSASALSIPESGDDFLITYMRKYGAEYVLLTQKELAFWRPAWGDPATRPEAFELVTRLGAAWLFRLKARDAQLIPRDLGEATSEPLPASPRGSPAGRESRGAAGEAPTT